MNSMMDDQINLELVKLQEELNLLDAAVKQIEKAGTISTAVVNAVKEIQDRYSAHLDAVIQKIDDHLANSSQYTNDKIKELADAHNLEIENIKKLLANYEQLAQASAKLPEEIGKIDFPARLTKIDTTNSEINQNILAIQKVIENSDKITKANYKKVTDLETQINKQKSQLSGYKYLMLFIILLLAGLVANIFFPLGNLVK
jgi:valyl-tRNA synthetase